MPFFAVYEKWGKGKNTKKIKMCGLAYFVDAQMIRMCAARDAHMKIRKTKGVLREKAALKVNFLLNWGRLANLANVEKKSSILFTMHKKEGCLQDAWRDEKKSLRNPWR